MHSRFNKHKFRAKPVIDDGARFPSKLEHAYYQKLQRDQKDGSVLFFLRQVPFHLVGGIKYVLDFMVFYSDGSIRFLDIKGMETAEFLMKKKMVEATFPVEIEVIKKYDFRRA